MGYLTSDHKPVYKTIGILKVKGGLWTVIEVLMRGNMVQKTESLITPTVKALAVEKYKREIARQFLESFDDQ